MLKQYLSKFTIDILPSVLATVVGAYIVNYYVIPKARDDRAPAAAVATLPDIKTPEKQPKSADAKPADAKPVDVKPVADGVETPVRKPAAEKAEKSESAKAGDKAAESRRHIPAREKAVAKAEVPAAPMPAPAAAPMGDDRRDANDLARAAIERLRHGEAKAPEVSPPAEAPRAPEHTASVQPLPVPAPQPVQQAQPMQQLPPPIVVSNPAVENPEQPTERAERSRGPRPPSDIPVPLESEGQANAGDRGVRTNVAEDVLSAAKSMFDKVIPKPFER